MKKLLREVIEHWDDEDFWIEFSDYAANYGIIALILFALGWIIAGAIML